VYQNALVISQPDIYLYSFNKWQWCKYGVLVTCNTTQDLISSLRPWLYIHLVAYSLISFLFNSGIKINKFITRRQWKLNNNYLTFNKSKSIKGNSLRIEIIFNKKNNNLPLMLGQLFTVLKFDADETKLFCGSQNHLYFNLIKHN